MQPPEHRIQDAREDAGVSRKHLASLIGVSERQLRRYEQDGVQPPLDVAVRIAQSLGCSLHTLIGEE